MPSQTSGDMYVGDTSIEVRLMQNYNIFFKQTYKKNKKELKKMVSDLSAKGIDLPSASTDWFD